jgi:hypothetical protein
MPKSSPVVKRRDASGHMDPHYARDLLEKARENRNLDDSPESARAFILDTKYGDPASDGFGEAFLEAATSGEDSEPARRDRVTPDEYGGPFVYTTGRDEFSLDVDDPSVADVTREPFPRTSRGFFR